MPINLGLCLEQIRSEIEPLVSSKLGYVTFDGNPTPELGIFTLPHPQYGNDYPFASSTYDGIICTISLYKAEDTGYLATDVNFGDPSIRCLFAIIFYSYNSQELLTFQQIMKTNFSNIKAIQIMPSDITNPSKPNRLVAVLMYDVYDTPD